MPNRAPDQLRGEVSVETYVVRGTPVWASSARPPRVPVERSAYGHNRRVRIVPSGARRVGAGRVSSSPGRRVGAPGSWCRVGRCPPGRSRAVGSGRGGGGWQSPVRVVTPLLL